MFDLPSSLSNPFDRNIALAIRALKNASPARIRSWADENRVRKTPASIWPLAKPSFCEFLRGASSAIAPPALLPSSARGVVARAFGNDADNPAPSNYAPHWRATLLKRPPMIGNSAAAACFENTRSGFVGLGRGPSKSSGPFGRRGKILFSLTTAWARLQWARSQTCWDHFAGSAGTKISSMMMLLFGSRCGVRIERL